MKNFKTISDKDFKLSDVLPEDNTYYQFSKKLEDAVSVAIFLGKPLLITGEPGTGKTTLARAVVNKLNKNLAEKKKIMLRTFHTKTTSTAKDLLYTYDHLAHFHFIHKSINTPEKVENESKAEDKKNTEINSKFIWENFIKLNALGEAILSDKRDVVLIDEIDKAPRDLPNDLLNEIENMKFDVPELKFGTDHKTVDITKKKKEEDKNKCPIVILTSNSEKSLPEAFLRRCVFFHIDFKDIDLIEILKNKISNPKENTIWDILTTFFYEQRDLLTRKKPATSELIHWVYLLNELDFDSKKLLPFVKNKEIVSKYKIDDKLELADEDKRNLLLSFTVLAKNVEDLTKLQRLIDEKE